MSIPCEIIHAGAKVNFDKCWFEASATPNWATNEVRVESGAVSFHDCHWAWAQRAVYAGGNVSFSGNNTLRTATTGVTIASDSELTISGQINFLGAGTPVWFTDSTSSIDWQRNDAIAKTSNYGLSSKDIGAVFSNFGAKQNIAFTMVYSPHGASFTFINALTSVRNSTYKWTLSGSGTDEYYMDLAAGGTPGFSDPTTFYDYATVRIKGTVGSLSAGEWGYGNTDTLGYNTIYYRGPAGADPDSQSADTISVSYKITITPTNNQRLPLPATSPSDAIISDGVTGTHMKMRNFSGSWYIKEASGGTWS